MSQPKRSILQSLLPTNRHWTDTVLAVSAIVISAFSLWVAISTERTNRELVAAASWPFLQVYNSGGGQQALTVNLSNAGIGPAKIETFELFWNGKQYESVNTLLKDCCSPDAGSSKESASATEIGLGTSDAAGTVLRAGDVVPLIHYELSEGNAEVWKTFKSERFKIGYSVCYCSVFNECWIGAQQRLSDAGNLHPREVKSCPAASPAQHQ